VAVISVGADNRFGHPSPDILQRYGAAGIPVLRTDKVGTVELSVCGKRLWVETTCLVGIATAKLNGNSYSLYCHLW
jgi:competence protein ComEC